MLYDPLTGRFLQQDHDPGRSFSPITSNNKYVYSGNNSLNLRDPSGQSFLKDLGRLIVGVVAFAAAVFTGGAAIAALGLAVGSFSAIAVGIAVGAFTGGAVGAILFPALDLGTAQDGFRFGSAIGAVGGGLVGAGVINPSDYGISYKKKAFNYESTDFKKYIRNPKIAKAFKSIEITYEVTRAFVLPATATFELYTCEDPNLEKCDADYKSEVEGTFN